ncbi:MAG TPA: hypothetical protein ENJ82_10750 [Bacteroidetes bacterium]|nr:hypothetical protein [Bacteroidota bacterium]
MRKTVILGLLVAMQTCFVFGQTETRTLQEQVVVLENSIGKLQDELEFQKRENELAFREAEVEGEKYFWGILLALLLGPVAVLLKSLYDTKRLAKISEEKVKAHFEKSFPEIAKTQINLYLEKEVPARIESLIKASKSQEEEDALRQTARILVVAEDEATLKTRTKFLRGKGYKHVSSSLALPFGKLPENDVCILDYYDWPSGDKRKSSAYVESLLKHYGDEVEKGILFCFPIRVERLDYTLVKKKGFSNMESTLDTNLLQLIRQIKPQ